MITQLRILAMIALLAGLIAPATAEARVANVRVSVTNGFPTVAWDPLPPGEQIGGLEIATSPEVQPPGSAKEGFFTGTIASVSSPSFGPIYVSALNGYVGAKETLWSGDALLEQDRVNLEPGTYYLHVVSFIGCYAEPLNLCNTGAAEWSDTVQFTVLDTTPPDVVALEGFGAPGKIVRLEFLMPKEEGKIANHVRIFRRARVVGGFRHDFQGKPGASLYFYRWRAPKRLGLLRYCIRAIDEAGNRSKQSCAPLVITARPPKRKPPADGGAPLGDYDCADFPLSDGTSAQEYLSRYPGDPSNLDSDGDGAACE